MNFETKNNLKISILGCGWLGFPLAKALLEKNCSIKGSTTSPGKIRKLENLGIEAFLIELSENAVTGNIEAFLADSDVVIIDIPPKLRGEAKENFVAKIKHLIPFIEKANVNKVLFVSSTAVYPDNNAVVTEETMPNPATESGIQLLASETLLQSNNNFQTTVLRFGGLIGEDRHPAKSLAGKTNLANPDGPINVIHLTDCIGIIIKIIQTNRWNETFNAVAPFHPTREEYYTEKAIQFNLPLPQFDHSNSSVGKTIDSSKAIQMLNYRFSNNVI